MKIGEGKMSPNPSEEGYRKKLIQSAARFEKALDDFLKATTEERGGLQKEIGSYLTEIHDAAVELPRSGLHKQLSLVESDYKRYMKNPSEENYTALIQDLSTLREYSRLPVNKNVL